MALPRMFCTRWPLRTALAAALGWCAPLAAQDDATTQPVAAPAAQPSPAAKPVRARLAWTQFVDSVVEGDAPSEANYGGKIDAYVNVNGSALGLDDSIAINLHPEFRYGESANGAVGLLPVNSQLFYPRADGEVFDLSADVTKTFASGATLAVGKFNLLEVTEALPVIGGGGIEGFANLGLALPPSTIVPGSIAGVMLNVPTKRAYYRLWVFEPEGQSRRTGLEDPFARGVTALGAVTFPASVGGQRGFYTVKAIGSTRTGANFAGFPPALVPPPAAGFDTAQDAWALAVSFQQYLTSDPTRPGSGVGVFGEIAVLDGHPTPLDFHAFAGVSGNLAARPRDRFGVAVFHYSLSDRLVSALVPRVALGDEVGFEAFYTLQVAKPVRLTADVQVVDSAVRSRSTGVIAGLRLKAQF